MLHCLWVLNNDVHFLYQTPDWNKFNLKDLSYITIAFIWKDLAISYCYYNNKLVFVIDKTLHVELYCSNPARIKQYVSMICISLLQEDTRIK